MGYDLFFFVPFVKPDRVYYAALTLGLPLEFLALYCYMKAIKVSPLSLTLPLLTFTPALIILTGWILLGEQLTSSGTLGIVLIVIGSYCLNLTQIRVGFLAPLRAVIQDPGSRLMLLVSCIYSVTAVIGKIGILHSNPYFFAVTYFTALTVLMLSLMPLMPEVRIRCFFKTPLKGVILGATHATMILSHTLAISQVQAAYMMSLKRTSVLIGILYGAWWFKEEDIGERLFGTAIMVAGAFCIGWFS
ncbi:MAG: EamA family transporter [Thermodesulfobacteriota bacterium]|nr:EamA family transporter [Thermodesulfobacteriota bacterium]